MTFLLSEDEFQQCLDFNVIFKKVIQLKDLRRPLGGDFLALGQHLSTRDLNGFDFWRTCGFGPTQDHSLHQGALRACIHFVRSTSDKGRAKYCRFTGPISIDQFKETYPNVAMFSKARMWFLRVGEVPTNPDYHLGAN